VKSIVIIPSSKDSRKKTWRKQLEGVDKSKSNGYAFIGGWLKAGERAELEAGTFVLTYDEPGSMKNWKPLVRLFKVTGEGLEKIFDWEGDYCERSWALAVRDKIADILAEAKHEQGEDEDSLKYTELTDDELIAELNRRGYTVTK